MPALQDVIASIASRCPGWHLPDSYLVLDLETSGLDRKNDVITQYGFAAVKDRQLVDNMAVYVKRPRGTMSEGAMRVTGITDELLMEQGVEPATVLQQMLNLMEVYRSSGCMFMGHNLISFDAPFIRAECERYSKECSLDLKSCVDTGMMFKAAQLRLTPGGHESLLDFFGRINGIHSHARWNLKLAAQMLNVDRTNGLNMDEAHDAGFDCLVTHLVFETMRELAGL